MTNLFELNFSYSLAHLTSFEGDQDGRMNEDFLTMPSLSFFSAQMELIGLQFQFGWTELVTIPILMNWNYSNISSPVSDN
jgi:hypothetical protein